MMILFGEINIDPLLKAQAFFSSGLKEAKSELEKAGVIQAFEICYELAWKTMKRVLAYRGIEGASPREVFRLAAQEKLIGDPEIWFEFIIKCNQTVHVYNEKIAREIFLFLPKFSDELECFIQTVKKLQK